MIVRQMLTVSNFSPTFCFCRRQQQRVDHIFISKLILVCMPSKVLSGETHVADACHPIARGILPPCPGRQGVNPSSRPLAASAYVHGGQLRCVSYRGGMQAMPRPVLPMHMALPVQLLLLLQMAMLMKMTAMRRPRNRNIDASDDID